MQATVNLQNFCSDDEFVREVFKAPFSYGDFTYATDSAIIVRVPRDHSVAKTADSIIIRNLELVFARHSTAQFDEPAVNSLPNLPEVKIQAECSYCDGRGTEHECSSCDCMCEGCDGDGSITTTQVISCEAWGRVYRLKYIRDVLALPGVAVEKSPPGRFTERQPLHFTFEGGCGALMPRLSKADHHVAIDVA